MKKRGARWRENRGLIWLLISAIALSACAPRPRQMTATFVAKSPNETDSLQITVVENSLALTGTFEIAAKQADGKVKVWRIPITGDVSTSGVPASITLPSSVVGAPNLTFGCFFDKSLNLTLVGNNTIRFPRRLYRVK